MHHRIAELGVGARGDRVQVPDGKLGGDGLATALKFHFRLPADGAIQDVLKRLELRDVAAVDAHQDVPGLQHVLAGTPGSTSVITSMPVLRGKSLRTAASVPAARPRRSSSS